jgi:hypothetical protein
MKRLIPLALATLSVAGCGDSSPSLSAFKPGFKSDKASFQRLGVDLQHAIASAQNKSDAQVSAEIGALARRARHQADSLSKLNAPARFQRELHRMVVGFRALGADLGQISSAAQKHDGAAAQRGTVALLRDAARVKASDRAISSGLHLPLG